MLSNYNFKEGRPFDSGDVEFDDQGNVRSYSVNGKPLSARINSRKSALSESNKIAHEIENMRKLINDLEWLRAWLNTSYVEHTTDTAESAANDEGAAD